MLVEKSIQIIGGKKLTGTIEVSGAKNAVLKQMILPILSEGVYKIENVPNITDVYYMQEVLEVLGITSKLDEKIPEKAGEDDSKNSEEYFDVPNTMNETYFISSKSSETLKETSYLNKDSVVNMSAEKTRSIKETPEWVKNFVNDEKIEIEETSCEEFYTELFPSQPMSKISEEFLDQKVSYNFFLCQKIFVVFIKFPSKMS